mmetsp:Transcript_36973/g.80280  ORF Transcript_36973/g.80280 Transcript_36973/m.80280 type:complete len:580 (-) Transcript_36973:398-2137(-)
MSGWAHRTIFTTHQHTSCTTSHGHGASGLSQASNVGRPVVADIRVDFVLDTTNLKDGYYMVGEFSCDDLSKPPIFHEWKSPTQDSSGEKRYRRRFFKSQFPLAFALSHRDCSSMCAQELHLTLEVEAVLVNNGHIDLTSVCEKWWPRQPPAESQNNAAVDELRRILEGFIRFKTNMSEDLQSLQAELKQMKSTSLSQFEDIRSLQLQQALLKQNSATADQSSLIGFLETEMTALRQELQAHSKRDHGAYTEKEKALSKETKDWSKIQADNLDKLRADVQKDQLSLRTEMLAEVERRIDAKLGEAQIKPIAAKQGAAQQNGISELITKLQRDSDAQSKRIQSLEDRLPDQEDLKEKNRTLEGVLDAQLKEVRRYVQEKMEKVERFEQTLLETAATVKTLKGDLPTSSKYHTKDEISRLMDARATEVRALKEDIQKQLLSLRTKTKNLKTSNESQFSQLKSNLEELMSFKDMLTKQQKDEVQQLQECLRSLQQEECELRRSGPSDDLPTLRAQVLSNLTKVSVRLVEFEEEAFQKNEEIGKNVSALRKALQSEVEATRVELIDCRQELGVLFEDRRRLQPN